MPIATMLPPATATACACACASASEASPKRLETSNRSVCSSNAKKNVSPESAPRANAIYENMIGTLRRVVLDWLLIRTVVCEDASHVRIAPERTSSRYPSRNTTARPWPT
jgi:hypothetical protein